MLHVLREFCKSRLLDADCHTDPAQAQAALSGRFSTFDADYAGVVLGWPAKNSEAPRELLDTLTQVDHSGLPVVILCQQISGEIRAIARQRPATRVLLWRDYQQFEQLLTGGATDSTVQVPVAGQMRSSSEWRLLLIDSAPSVSIALRNAARDAGHTAIVAGDVESAMRKLNEDEYNLVAIDQQLLSESNALITKLKTLADFTCLVVLADTLSNSAMLRSAEAGADACFEKSESSAVLCQQLVALAAVSSGQQVPVEDPEVTPLVAADLTAAVQQVLDGIDQPVLIVDQTDGVAVASAGAQAILGAVSDKAFAEIAGQSLDQLQQASGEHEQLELSAKNGEGHQVSWQCRSVSIDGMEELLQFTFAEVPPEPEPESAPVVEAVTVVPSKPRKAVLSPHELQPAIAEQMQLPASSGCQSTLLLNIEIVAGSGDRMDLGSSEPMLKIVRNALANVYKSERSLAYLGEGKFAFLLSTTRLQDALVLTRKLLQVIPQMVRYADSLKLVSHGALLCHDQQSVLKTPDEVLQLCSQGCDTSRKRGDNLVYVIHMNQWLKANSQKNLPQRTEKLEAPA